MSALFAATPLQYGRMLRVVALIVLAWSCSPKTSRTDGGAGAAGGAAGAFTIVELDPSARGLYPLAMAVDPADDRVVIAYFTPRGTQTVMGVDDLNLNVVEWRDGVTTPPQTIRFMQRTPGVAVALHPTTKEPTVAFMGGPDRLLPDTPSAFWFQHDASLAIRSGTTWTEVAARTEGDVCGIRPGSVVGLWPALRFDATGAVVFVWRDIHSGQGPADFTESDLESVEGPLSNLVPSCVVDSLNRPLGFGARLMMVAGPHDETVLVYDGNVRGAETVGQHVVIQRRTATGWTSPVIVLWSLDTETGPQVAWDPTVGYAVAAIRDRSVFYRRSFDGTAWENDEMVLLSAAWSPSLAIDPVAHEPSIAFYHCVAAPDSGVPDCQTSEDRLGVISRRGGDWAWTPVTVDEEGGWSPKLGFFATGKRVIAYRVANTTDGSARAGVLKLAIER